MSRPAQYASKIRAKLRNNEPITEEQAQWLASYDAQTKRGRPAKAPPPLPSQEPSPVVENPHSPTGGVPIEPPSIDVRSPSDSAGESRQADIGEDGPSSNESGSATSDAKSEGDPSSSKEQDEAHYKKCATLAAMWGAWMKAGQQKIRESGSKLPTLTDQIIDGGLVPMCFEALSEYLPRGSSASGGAILCVGASGYNIIGVRKARQENEGGNFKPKDPNGVRPSPPPPPPPSPGEKIHDLIVTDKDPAGGFI